MPTAMTGDTPTLGLTVVVLEVQAALGRDLAWREGWAAGAPGQSSKSKQQALTPAPEWGQGLGGWGAAVAAGQALEAAVVRGGQGAQQDGQSRSLGWASKGAGGTAGKGLPGWCRVPGRPCPGTHRVRAGAAQV